MSHLRLSVWSGYLLMIAILGVFVLLVLGMTLIATRAQDDTPTAEEPTLVVTDPAPNETAVPSSTPEPVLDPVIPPDVMTPEDAGNLGLNAILAIVAAFAGSALTTTIVSVLKMFLPTDAFILKNVVGGVLTVLYWLAVRYGFGEMFASVGQFLITFVPAFLTLYGTLAGSSVLHRQAVAHSVPILSYQRTP